MAGENLAWNIARGPVQHAPLGDGEPGRGGGLGMVRFGHTDVVDQTQRACKRRGDGEVGLRKRLVHTGEHLSVFLF